MNVLGETQTMCFVTGAMQVHGGQRVTVHSDNKLKPVCATTVHQKMWCAVGVSVYARRLPGDEISGKRHDISEQRRKFYYSVQDNVCHESQLRFDFQSLLCCQCDDEDKCVVLEEG